MTHLQNRQAAYLQDLFTLCESWLYKAVLGGGVPAAGSLAVRAAALQQACAGALGANALPEKPLSLNEWLPDALQPGRVAGLHTPLLYLPQDCLCWGWLDRRLRSCGGDRPALEILAAAFAAAGLTVEDSVEQLAAWHRVVALCLAAQLQLQDTGDAAGTCRTLVTLLAGKTTAQARRSPSLLSRMNTHCAALRGKSGKHAADQLSLWGNSYTLLQLVYAAKADCALPQEEPTDLLPAGVLRTHKKPDLAKVASLWKLTAMEPGEWSRLTGDGYQWLQDTRAEDMNRMLERYGEKHTAYSAEEVPEDTQQPAPQKNAGGMVPLLDYCYYAGDPHFAPIVMARWKNDRQLDWDGENCPAAQPAEWYLQGGPRAHLLMERYSDCCNAMGHRAGRPYYDEAALQAFARTVQAAGDCWDAVPRQFDPVKKPKAAAKPPARFDMVKLFGAKPSRTARTRFVQGLWLWYSASVPGWQPDAAGVAALEQWLEQHLCANAVWQGLGPDAFADTAPETAAPPAFAQTVCAWGGARCAASPEWAAAYLSYKGKQAAWVFTVPEAK